jgi:hypothetical protein
VTRFDSGSLDCDHPRLRRSLGCSGSSSHSRSECAGHWWDEDVAARRAELEGLKNRASSSDGVTADTDATVSEFFARTRKDVAAITEVSVPIC